MNIGKALRRLPAGLSAGGWATPFGQFADICRMVKIEHSIFALPYAWAGAVLAARGLPPVGGLVFLTLAMVAARSFAMAFNRLADLPFDRDNPRTCARPLVTGAISTGQTKAFCLFMAAVFILCCAALNSVCLYLAVPALIFSAVYSLLKRVSCLCHFWLGATLGLAPLAGWLSVTPEHLGMPAILLCCAVTFWVGAFDVYYAMQDLDFDRAFGLHSLPADMGPACALRLALFSHAMTSLFLLLAGLAAKLAWPWYALWLGVSLLLFAEHRLVRPHDLTHVNTAFFTLNGVISPLILIGAALGVTLA